MISNIFIYIYLNVKIISILMSSFNQTFDLEEGEELRIFLSEGEEIAIMVRRLL